LDFKFKIEWARSLEVGKRNTLQSINKEKKKIRERREMK